MRRKTLKRQIREMMAELVKETVKLNQESRDHHFINDNMVISDDSSSTSDDND